MDVTFTSCEGLNLVMVLIFLFRIKNPESKVKMSIVMSLVSCILILEWYFYAKSYNQQNGDSYYFLRIAPIWKLSVHDIGLGIWRMSVSWSKNYFMPATSLLLIASVYFLVKNWKKLNIELRLLIILSFTLTIFYIVFFYQKMIGHEYYYAAFYIFVLFGLIGLLKVYNLFHAENVFRFN